MGLVDIADIATKRRGEPDSSGDVWYSIKATATNNTTNLVEVGVDLQAIDDEGFELTTVTLVGVLEPGETKVLTGRDYMQADEFEQIARWQVSRCSVYDID